MTTGRIPSEMPWQDPCTWQEVRLFFDTVKRHSSSNFESIACRATALHRLYEDLSRPMEALCAATCITCEEVCCRKATIWYDFKDLVCAAFALGNLPRAQITRTPDGAGGLNCIHLSSSGCGLVRTERPFVCTWYLCPAQKKRLDTPENGNGEIPDTLLRMKQMRNEMEYLFCRISSGMTV